MPKLSRNEISNKIIIKSHNKFVLKALCEELLRYEFKHDPLVLHDNESIIKIDLENKTITLIENKESYHFETPKEYMMLVKKIESVCKSGTN
jgi:hypothetical protein